MQTVPSLIGTGTAIAAAASGLVFGQPIEPTPTPTKKRHSQLRKEISFDRDLPVTAPLGVLSSPLRYEADFDAPSIEVEYPQQNAVSSPITVSRPPLSRYQRPAHQPVASPKGIADRRSLLRQREASASPTPEGPRDSTSSSGSWIRRLSIRRRPSSRQGSIRSRSSVGPDSPSIAQSYTSSAPILPRPNTAATLLAPNKLVKRSPSVQAGDAPAPAHVRSKSHLSILRRPATSHQRSATLHHFRQSTDLSGLPSPAFSFDQSSQQERLLAPALAVVQPRATRKTSWISFFHSRTSTIGGGGGSIASRLGEGAPRGRTVSGKRISPSGRDRQRVHLVTPRMVSAASAPPIAPFPMDRREEVRQARDETGVHVDDRSISPENTPAGKATRPLSVPFPPVSNWISRTSGSLRRPKRGAEPDGVDDRRHVSAPSNSGAQIAVEHDSTAPAQSPIPPNSLARQGPTLDSAARVQLTMHKRSHSSPLLPAPRKSSFQIEVPRLGSPGGAASHPTRQHQPSGSSTSSAAMSQLRASPFHEGFSLTEGFESDARGFTSGDEDDADYKSDTVFDSLRTAASSRTRAVETPLDSVYDDSPPSTAGNNGKTKRLSIQEILGHTWGGDTDIMEEDESTIMSIGESGGPRSRYTSRHVLTLPRISSESSTNGVSLYAKEFGRISLDDDFDEDWVGDDDAPFNPLSPPSKGSSLNSRGINPNVRIALANMSLDQMSDLDQDDRPLNNLFDWSETSAHDKSSSGGVPLRPKTSYEKQELDARGGRSVIRNPIPAHIRSQSVPLSHAVDETKSSNGAKFGTWGLGTKTVSEDWDEDFEFGGGANEQDGTADSNLFSVPESIRASQPSVKAHSGQIRELSLLVNDLKRLCRHGRDMDMLEGPQKTLWKEAEGVIALASPDEEDSMDGENDANSSDTMDEFDNNDGFSEDEFDDLSFSKLDMAFDIKEPMSKTAVIRERHSPKRRSVFSPDDDIFGGNWPLVDDNVPSNRSSRPRTPELRADKEPEAAKGARSVMEAMHRSIPNHEAQPRPDNKMHFDTNSLRVLVKRAGELRDSLSDVIRRAEQITQSPAGTPRRERQTDSSPAFTRMFDDPGSSQSRRTARHRSNLSTLLDTSSPENSSSSSPMPRRLQTMIAS
ncbi:hypothetical protein TARUN_4113 [Trichoderma arundinaceum]|uniref:Uncharacterized protein n=1 Tax=Trichoderma arundinaceum TaxID=490622 RepID=A0A395NPU8_TRIAR|nr:hypothetical protein TARUN_4113 [Trichoderma arundinaceum]